MANKTKKILSFLRANKKGLLMGAAATGALGFGVLITAFFFHEIREAGEKNNQESILKIGFSTDWEYGSRSELKHKLPRQALPELRKIVELYNTVFKPDIVIGGGDYIESSATKPEDAKRQLTEINTIFSTLEAPRLYALGNHDMRSLTKGEVMDLLGITESHALRDVGDWRLVVIDTNFNKEDDSDRNAKNYVDGYVSQAELEWLDRALDTDRPTIVFSHHSPYDTPTADPNKFTLNILNSADLRALLETRPNVVASVAGHTPKPHYANINGVHYFVADTLVHDSGLGAFATLVATYEKKSGEAAILFEHYGLNRQTFEAEKDILDCDFLDFYPKFKECFQDLLH